jgi:tungstate transport system substrate-binding protein
MKKIRLSPLIYLLVALVILAACAPAAPANKDLILATTTSTQDSGLLDELVPVFQEDTGYVVKTVAVGTGEALEMGKQGNADVLLVHAPASEKELMAEGSGAERLLVMHNDFVIVGPAADPAAIKGTPTAVEAFQKIAAAEAPFISRGDDSGTTRWSWPLEKGWHHPEGGWYQGQGQGWVRR